MARNLVAGHSSGFIQQDRYIYKKVLRPEEKAFYQQINSPDIDNNAALHFRRYIPRFYGVEVIRGEEYLKLDDLTYGINYPSILDCKLGRVTWCQHHNQQKARKHQQKAQQTTTNSLGFRLSGGMYRDAEGKIVEQWQKHDKFTQINDNNIHKEFQKFITKNNALDVDVAERFIGQTREILGWFQHQTSYKFYSMSILYVFSNDMQHTCRTRLIDFAHVMNSGGDLDHNVINALENLLQIWEKSLTVDY